MLDSYKCCELEPAEPPTLLEIAGFPYRENVYSNILAFFLDTQQAHGFGTLFVQSILAAYKKKCPDEWPGKNLKPDIILETCKVEREAFTASGKYIDLLVESPEFVVCIENKIWSGLQNDLGKYRKHCELMSGERPVLGIVLSPYQLNQDNCQILKHKFVNITYSDFAEELQHRSGKYIDRHNTQYQYLLFDFVEQASRLEGKKIMTDNHHEFLKFWRDNDKKISNIQSMCNELRKELRAKEKAHNHIDKCKERLIHMKPSYKEPFPFKPWIYAGHVAVFDLKENGTIDGCGIFLDVEFHPLRITHILGKRRGSDPTALVTKIKECQPTLSFKSSTGSDRYKLATEDTPFNDSVCDQAVEISVHILKYIAERYLAEKDS